MLRVFRASGEALAVNFEEFVETANAGERLVCVRDLKRHLQGECGLPRFRQRLLLPDGQILQDDAVLEGAIDVQLLLVPFVSRSREDIRQLTEAARQSDIAAVEQLLARPQDPSLKVGRQTPLLCAVEAGCLEVVCLLLEAKADTDRTDSSFSTTPIFMASSDGFVEAVHALLEAKADMNKSNKSSRTPLLAASSAGRTEVVGLLLQAQANIEKADDDGTTPLLAASRYGHTEVVRLLLEAKADTNTADLRGETSMLMACRSADLEAVQLLLEAKADMHKNNNSGETALMVAAWLRHMEVAQFLRGAQTARQDAPTVAAAWPREPRWCLCKGA